MSLLYIYTYLDTEEPVLCGAMKTVIDEDGQKQAIFRYHPDYLSRETAYALDPIHLPLPESSDKLYHTPLENNVSSFGIFLDSVPDNWGRARMLRAAGRALSATEFIKASGEDRLGALAFSDESDGPKIIAPWANIKDEPSYLDLDDIEHALSEEEYKIPEESAKNLLLYGSSLGGARPKATVLHQGQLWLAKAPRHDDPRNVVKIEHATMNIARKIGLEVPETKVVTVNGKDIFLIKRFDREYINGKLVRYPVMSAYTAFGFPKQRMRIQKEATYNILAEKIGKISNQAGKDKKELFSRLCFNVIYGNTDDHSKNHSFIHKNGSWRLSPLYDVVPILNLGIEGQQSMRFGSEGAKRSISNLLSKHNDFDLSHHEALTCVNEVIQSLKIWERNFEGANLSRNDREGLKSTFSIGIDFTEKLNKESNKETKINLEQGTKLER